MKIINILPPARQEELKYAELLYSFKKFFAVTVITFIVVIFAQWGVKFYLQSQVSYVNKQIDLVKQQVNKQENSKIKQQITGINNVISDYTSLVAAAPKWSKVIKAFSVLPPSNIKIMSFTVDLAKKEVAITGFSPDRQSVIDLHDRIEADSGNFTNINYPLENIAKATNINFHFNFTVKDSLLQ